MLVVMSNTATAGDVDRVCETIRAMGYTDVELLWSFDNFGRTTAQVKAVLTTTGLKAPSAHIAPEILLKDWNKSLDTAKELGHDSLIVPSLPKETDTSLDAWRVWADRFNTAGEAARRVGLWLAFHNEPNHMKAIAHQVPYDLFVSLIDVGLVRLQLDVGNMIAGGGDPQEYLKKYEARYHSFHLKDMVADRSHDTELGTGVFNAKTFLAAVKNLDKILSTPGLDGVYVGPSDLSISYGMGPGMDHTDEKRLDLIMKILKACKKHGVVAGLHTGSTAYAKRMREAGYQLTTLLNDSRIMAAAATAMVDAILDHPNISMLLGADWFTHQGPVFFLAHATLALLFGTAAYTYLATEKR